jgi:hypothetical protein
VKGNLFGKFSIASECLLLFAEDMARALMRPLIGSRYRILHALHTPQFRVPSGFNTPVDVPNWLSSGALVLRRSILAVLVSRCTQIADLFPFLFNIVRVFTAKSLH